MANTYFQFKQFIIHQQRAAMKVTTDACLFGAWVAEKIRVDKAGVSMLEVGTGIGILPLMILQKNQSLNIEAIEIDENAFEEAINNITASPWPTSARVFLGDASHYKYSRKYDSIVANPPFYEKELSSPDAGRTLAHHAGLSLNSLLNIIHLNLANEGRFYLLLPFKRRSEIIELLKKNALAIHEIILVKQTREHQPFRMMIEGAHSKNVNEHMQTEIIIMNERREYTQAFRDLLKDYYLNL